MSDEEQTLESESRSYRGDGTTHVEGRVLGGISHQYSTMNLQITEQIAHEIFRRQTESWSMDRKSLERLHKLFVPPGKFEQVQTVLEERGIAVITGEIGSGRRTAAMMALFSTTNSWSELPTESEDDSGSFFNISPTTENEGLLLDLTMRNPEIVQQALRQIQPFRSALTKNRSRLAIVIPKEAESQLDIDLRASFVHILRPDATLVFGNHLSALAVSHTNADVRSTRLTNILRSGRMEEFSKLAYLVSDARAASSRASFTEWLDSALKAFRHRGDEVRGWMRDNQKGSDRALLLAAAMLEGASTDAVFDATVTLLETVQFPEDDIHLLERSGITERLRALRIGLDDKRKIRFNALDYATAVRTYFWADHPDLRDKLRDWVATVAQSPYLSQPERQRLAYRFAEQCLDVGRAEDLISVITQWIGGANAEGRQLMFPCSGIILEAGLRDERFGGVFRRKVYEWAARPDAFRPPPDFDETIINLCVTAIAPSHPDQALVRLHHMVNRRTTSISDTALGRIVQLTDDPIFLRRLLHRLAEKLPERYGSHDTELFRMTTTPMRLTDSIPMLAKDRRIRSQLVTIWEAALGQQQDIEETVHSWLNGAAHDSRRAFLLKIPIEASVRRTVALGKLYRATQNWVQSAQEEEWSRRILVAGEFCDLIDASQGLSFLARNEDDREQG